MTWESWGWMLIFGGGWNVVSGLADFIGGCATDDAFSRHYGSLRLSLGLTQVFVARLLMNFRPETHK
jgi:hypothetical protein